MSHCHTLLEYVRLITSSIIGILFSTRGDFPRAVEYSEHKYLTLFTEVQHINKVNNEVRIVLVFGVQCIVGVVMPGLCSSVYNGPNQRSYYSSSAGSAFLPPRGLTSQSRTVVSLGQNLGFITRS